VYGAQVYPTQWKTGHKADNTAGNICLLIMFTVLYIHVPAFKCIERYEEQKNLELFSSG
jgi:hypothetical protein